jgi:hypothetical protein
MYDPVASPASRVRLRSTAPPGSLQRGRLVRRLRKRRSAARYRAGHSSHQPTVAGTASSIHHDDPNKNENTAAKPNPNASPDIAVARGPPGLKSTPEV